MEVLSVFSSTFGDSKAMDNAITSNGAVGASVFGFVDGMLTGMATEVRSAFEDPKCSNTENVVTTLFNMTHHFGYMVKNMTSMKQIWSNRNQVFDSIKAFFGSMTRFLLAGVNYLWECPGTKMFVVMVHFSINAGHSINPLRRKSWKIH